MGDTSILLNLNIFWQGLNLEAINTHNLRNVFAILQ